MADDSDDSRMQEILTENADTLAALIQEVRSTVRDASTWETTIADSSFVLGYNYCKSNEKPDMEDSDEETMGFLGVLLKTVDEALVDDPTNATATSVRNQVAEYVREQNKKHMVLFTEYIEKKFGPQVTRLITKENRVSSDQAFSIGYGITQRLPTGLPGFILFHGEKMECKCENCLAAAYMLETLREKDIQARVDYTAEKEFGGLQRALIAYGKHIHTLYREKVLSVDVGGSAGNIDPVAAAEGIRELMARMTHKGKE